MKSQIIGVLQQAVLVQLFLLVAVAVSTAAEPSPLTPELAAKRENHRRQSEQQHITQDQRKAAAAALKAERLKVHQARQAVKRHKPAPVATDTK